MDQDIDRTDEAGHLLHDIEKELASIRTDVAHEKRVAHAMPPRLPAARIIDTRGINLNAGSLRKAGEGPGAVKSLRERLAAVKVTD